MLDEVYRPPNQIIARGRYPFTMGQLRHFLLYRHKNGLQNAVRRIGKRLMLRIDFFDQWIEGQKEDRHG